MRRSPVALIASHDTSIIAIAGKNPPRPVAIGKASMPPPMQVPATRKTVENNVNVEIDEWLVESCVCTISPFKSIKRADCSKISTF
jgi:hypothetical protein